MPHVSRVQQSLLLYLTSIECDFRYLEARILRDMERTNLGSIETAFDFLEGTNDSSMESIFLRSPPTPPQIGTLHPHKMPTCVSDIGV